MALTQVTAALLATLVVATSALPQNNTCISEGRFSDPSDCTSYIICLAKPEGGFTATKRSCKGYAFHPERKTCVSHEKVPNCKARDSRQIVSDSSLNELCTEDNFICSDCKTVINCVDGRAFIDLTCEKDYTCQTPDSFNGAATCYDKESESNECPCTEPNSFTVDPFNENGFYFCPIVDSDPMVHKCPGEMAFNEGILDCVNADGIPACTEGGVFANPADCSNYYTCIQTVNGWVQKTLSCEVEGEMYNENTMECSNPCSWPSPIFECEEEGRFPDPANCGNFYVCLPDPENEGMFKKTQRQCPLDYVWDPLANSGAGHCVAAAQQSTPCMPVAENKCPIPDSCEGGASGTDSGGDSDTPLLGDGSGSDLTAPDTDSTDDTATTDSGDSGTGTGGRFAFRSQNPFAEADSIQNVIQALKEANQ